VLALVLAGIMCGGLAEFLLGKGPVSFAGGDPPFSPARYGARFDATRTLVSRTANGSTQASVLGQLSSADIGKDLLVYAAAWPSTPGYRPNVFTGCIQNVSGRTMRLGVWQGGACVPASTVDAAVASGSTAIYGHDDTAALQAAVNALSTGNALFLDKTILIRDTIVFRNKSGGEFRGVGMNGQVRQIPFAGSNIVWAGPAGKPMLKFENSAGMYIHDLHLVGNSYPRSRPSALIDIAQSAGNGSPNRFHGISNMYGSALDSPFDTVDSGVSIDPGAREAGTISATFGCIIPGFPVSTSETHPLQRPISPTLPANMRRLPCIALTAAESTFRARSRL